MIDLPYFEDIIVVYSNYIIDTLYPKITRNKFKVYLISTIHIIGTLHILLGIFLPPKYLIWFLIYLILIAISYIFFNGYCFMTLLSNKYSGNKNCALYIRMKTAQHILLINIILVLIGIMFPKYAIYNIMKRLFSD